MLSSKEEDFDVKYVDKGFEPKKKKFLFLAFMMQ
jgi:hypothetical protein